MTKLYPYQEKAVRAINHFKGRILIADEMGLGKTIEVLAWLDSHPENYPALVVCPASVKSVWQAEAQTHIKTRSQVLFGRNPAHEGLFDPPPIIIINYDILKYWRKALKKIGIKTLIADESHYVKSRGAKRTRAVKTIAKTMKNVIALSGTPFTNRPSELFSVLNLVRPDLYVSFTSYAWEYCKPRRRPWGWEYSGARNLKQLHRKLKAKMMIRRRKRDVLPDLPQKTRSIIPIALDNSSEYVRAKSQFIDWLREKDKFKADRAEKAEALVKMGYLLRLASELKMPMVEEWIENFLQETDRKLVVFGVHKKIIHSLHEKHKKISVLVDGGTSQVDRHRAVRQFQTDKRTRLFIGNIKAGGVGITLTAASDLAFVEMTWTPGDHSQAEDRIHRIGQKNTACVRYFIAKGTIEENLCKIIQEKQKVIEKTLDGKALKGLDVFDQLVKALKK